MIAAGAAAIYAFLSPSVLEWRVQRACPQVTEQSCAMRARALAHLFAFEGNTERALHWYRKAAESGDAMSMFHLGWMIEQKALDGFQVAAFAAAASGNAASSQDAQSHIGDAVEWYRKSAAKGFAPAMNNLGQAYERGLATSRNPQMALYYYRMAAEAGNPIAGFNLALSGSFGLGLSEAEAKKWMEWSSARKHNKADLGSPTLERTRIMGGMPVEDLRVRLRAAANSGTAASVKLELRPLAPVASLPTFEQVRRASGGPARESR